MKYFLVVCTFVFAVFIDECLAKECGGGKAVPKAIVSEEAKAKGMKEIDVEESGNVAGERDHGVSEGRVMPREETYDENTGLPDVVPSDAEGEIN